MRPPRPPNRAGGFPAHGSPVGGFLIGGVSRLARLGTRRTARPPQRRHYLPPSTPFTSADTIRSVQIEASTHDQSPPVSAPCLALAGTVGAAICLSLSVTFPPSCPAFPRRGFALHASPGWRRFGTMRALTPAKLSPEPDRSLRLLRFTFRTSRPQPQHAPERRFISHFSAFG